MQVQGLIHIELCFDFMTAGGYLPRQRLANDQQGWATDFGVKSAGSVEFQRTENLDAGGEETVNISVRLHCSR